MVNKYFVLLTALFFITGCVGSTPKIVDRYQAKAKTATEIFEIAAKSTVIVLSYDEKNKITGFGSGVVLPNGSIATNCHVIEKASKIAVRHHQKEYPAATLHTDWDRDTCTITASGFKAPPLNLGSTTGLKVGARVYAIGAPQGLELTISEGIISSLRAIEGGQYIQTTTPISPGSSGGGLFDENGQLLGLMSFYLAEGQNLNFALPVEWITELPKRHEQNKNADTKFKDWLHRAVALEEKEDWQELALHASRWIEAMPHISEPWFCLGLAYRKSGHAARAIEAYQQALRINPDDFVTWTNLGYAYGQSGQPTKAIEAFQQVIRINPNDFKPWCDLGVAYGQTTERIKEIEAYQQALRINPDYSLAWYNLGVAYGQTGERIKEIEAYQQALRINPNDFKPWYNLGAAYGETGQWTRAIEAYQQALRINPDFSDAWYNLGVAYGQTGQWTKAIEAFQQVIRINPDFSDAWYSLGVAYGQSGQMAKAIEAFQQALRFNPDYSQAWYNLGIVYKASGQTGKVMEVYKRLQSLNPEKADEFFNKFILP